MEASLLATKIAVPPTRPRLVPRVRLIERLREGLDYDLVLVSAPAGFGKTTLLSEWACQNQSTAQTSWLSLDEGDSDPARFWDYFIAALQTCQPAIGGRALALLHSPQPRPVEPMLVALINDLANVAENLVLVLDDYQFVKSQDIHAGIAFLLEHMPPRLRLVIATRADPPLPLARLRGREKMLEIGADDLRFTLDEAAELLRVLRGTRLTTEDVTALNRRTEGWAVGLKMAALSMGPREDISEFIAGFAGSQRYIMDYLVEEVLQQQSGDAVDFLLKTSVLEKLTAPLCDAVTGRNDSQTLLPALERENLFLVPLDDAREWYRYEHLFVDLLRHQLAKLRGDETVTELHRRASRWYGRSGFPNEAVDHSLAARDWETAVSLILDLSERQRQTGEMVTLLGWLRALPEDILFASPALARTYAMALVFTRSLDAAEAVLERVEALVRNDTTEFARILAYRAIVASARGGASLPLAMEFAQKALPLLPPADLDLRGGISSNLGVMYWVTGRLREAEPLFWEAYEAGRQAGNVWLVASASTFLSSISQWRGELSRAVEFAEQAIGFAQESPAAAGPHIQLAAVFYERNDLDAATFHVNRGFELNRFLGTPQFLWEIYRYQTRIRLAQGDGIGALQAARESDQMITSDTEPQARIHRAGYHIQLALAQGDLDEASRWGEQLARHRNEVPFWYRLLLIRLLAMEGDNERMSDEIRSFYESTHVELLSPEWRGWLIAIRVAQALSASTPDEALGFLAGALAVGESEGWIRTFVDDGAALAPLLRKAVSRGITPNYAATLLTIIEAEAQGKAKGKARRQAAYGLLTERESEVLLLLAAGLSNREIAQRLFISPGTAKVHIHNISEKLNVTGRTKAVARARELKLI